MSFFYHSFRSPLGRIHLLANERALLKVDFDSHWKAPPEGTNLTGSPLLQSAEAELGEYFAGKRRKFSLPLEPLGTEFQKRAWRALQEIPYGQTVSYKQQALSMKHPKAVRAVGRANGCNPLGIIVPCHRVIGSDGSLTGYAGGMEIKQALLALEGSSR